MNSQYSIGELAALASCSQGTVRYYERCGIMPEPPRSSGGHRVYEDIHASRLTFILRARDMGFSIGGVKELLTLADRGDTCCAEARSIALGHLESVRAKLADLRKLEATLEDLDKRCQSGAKPDCAFIHELYRPRKASAVA